MKKTVLLSVLLALFYITFSATTKIYVLNNISFLKVDYKTNPYTKCWENTEEEYCKLTLNDNSSFNFFIEKRKGCIGYVKCDTFIYTGKWHKQHDTLFLMKNHSKNSITQHSRYFRNPIYYELDYEPPYETSYEPWQSINLLFIDSLSYIQKIKFPLVLKNNIKNINDYLHFSFNSNTITEEKMIFSLYEKSLLTIPNIFQR